MTQIITELSKVIYPKSTRIEPLRNGLTYTKIIKYLKEEENVYETIFYLLFETDYGNEYLKVSFCDNEEYRSRTIFFYHPKVLKYWLKNTKQELPLWCYLDEHLKEEEMVNFRIRYDIESMSKACYGSYCKHSRNIAIAKILYKMFSRSLFIPYKTNTREME